MARWENDARMSAIERGEGGESEEGERTYTIDIVKLLVVLTVLTLGIVVTGMGIAAEVINSKVQFGISQGECVYSTDSHVVLGIHAAVLLLVALVLVTVFGCSALCGRDLEKPLKRWTMRSIWISWIFFILAARCLMAGVKATKGNIHHQDTFPGKCLVVTLLTFTKGSLYGLISVGFGLNFYLDAVDEAEIAEEEEDDIDELESPRKPALTKQANFQSVYPPAAYGIPVASGQAYGIPVGAPGQSQSYAPYGMVVGNTREQSESYTPIGMNGGDSQAKAPSLSYVPIPQTPQE